MILANLSSHLMDKGVVCMKAAMFDEEEGRD
jgi:hypothetical protein